MPIKPLTNAADTQGTGSLDVATAFPSRIGFAGTPEFAASILTGLLAAGANIVCVYTQPDRPTGRGRKLAPSAVKQTALAAGREVRQPKSLRTDQALTDLLATKLDVLIVAAYGLILPQAVLDAPTLGCVNVHASLLPRWRGAAPIERAIMAGDTQSGVCIMRMEAGLDTGGVYNQRTLPLTDTTTGRELHDSLRELGLAVLLETLDGFDADAWQPQDDTLATYAAKLTSKDAHINWHQPARQIIRQVNALNDRMPARSWLGDETINLLRAAPGAEDDGTAKGVPAGTIIGQSKKTITVAAGEGAVRISEVQLRRGKAKPMAMAAALNGYAELFKVGRRFDDTAQTADKTPDNTTAALQK